MKELVFLLEESSAKVMIQGILRKFTDNITSIRFIVFEGKQDLDKQINRKLRCYNNPEAKFIILRDQDSSNCYNLKNNLKQKCMEANKPEAIVRIACRELESWYLADLKAVESAFSIHNLSSRQTQRRFQNPDAISNPSKELKKLVPEYQKINGSRLIAQFLDLNNNRSRSFYHFINSIKEILI